MQDDSSKIRQQENARQVLTPRQDQAAVSQRRFQRENLTITDFLQRLKANPNDYRRFSSDHITEDLRRLGFVDETDVIEIGRADPSKKGEKLIKILQTKSELGVVSALRDSLLKRRAQKNLAKLLPRAYCEENEDMAARQELTSRQGQEAVTHRRLPRQKQEVARRKADEIDYVTDVRLSIVKPLCVIVMVTTILIITFSYFAYSKMNFSNLETPSRVSIYDASWNDFARIICESGFTKWHEIGDRLGYDWATLEAICENKRGSKQDCRSLLQMYREKSGDSGKIRYEVIKACVAVHIGGRLEEFVTMNGYRMSHVLD
ncbi:uncharacterized protein [Oscarella lobularis]|uniref:uncharacterized protein isoform X2 n=1 Tax=Oscarella lobularis TaxID=121494 RepID=UPI00331334D6